MSRASLIALLAATMCAGCGKDTTTTSPSPTETDRSTEVFGGKLFVGDSQFYSFTVLQAGTVDVMLASLRADGAPTSPLTIVVGLGLGTPSGTDCALRSAITTAPGLTKQISVALDPSTYCVKIADVGNLTAPVDYTVRILHP